MEDGAPAVCSMTECGTPDMLLCVPPGTTGHSLHFELDAITGWDLGFVSPPLRRKWNCSTHTRERELFGDWRSEPMWHFWSSFLAHRRTALHSPLEVKVSRDCSGPWLGAEGWRAPASSLLPSALPRPLGVLRGPALPADPSPGLRWVCQLRRKDLCSFAAGIWSS